MCITLKKIYTHTHIYTVKKIFSRFVITTFFFFCQINFLMIKSISFIVLTHFFHFNQLKIVRQPGYLLF